ncbi:MAG: GatB/YqeY domain-containing protein, partial [Deltaproteobacteria bacterium]|nr:GatB/YqeY domain-containing protein [Deltaproteobacteria bacterium]
IDQTQAQSMKDIGKVMKVLMPTVKGKADGQAVNKIVKEELGGGE